MSEDDDRPLTITREDLYELVWSKPMQELAKDFSISDVGLAKRCRRLGIPVPGRGYWARVDAGQPVHRPKLLEREPEWSDRNALTLPADEEGVGSTAEVTPEEEAEHRRQDSVWLAERVTFEERPENRIVVDPSPTRWHPVIRRYRDELLVAATDMLKSKAAVERWEKLSEAQKRKHWNSDGYSWRSVERRGQRLRDTHKSTAVRVSLGTYERALTILEALARAAEVRGFAVVDCEEEGRIAVSGHGAEVQLRMAEQLEQKVRSVRRYDGQLENESCKVPTGKLRITLGGAYGNERYLEDRARAKLDDQLNELFVAVYRSVVGARRDTREQVARERRWAEEERLRKIAEEQEAQRRRKAAAERRRRYALAAEVRRWKQARDLRRYVAHVATAAATTIDESRATALAAWKSWALGVADELDPMAKRTEGGS